MKVYEPPKWNRANTVVPLLLYLCALVAYVGSRFTPYPVILQTIALVSLLSAILLTARYSLSSRRYLLSDATAEEPYGSIRVLRVQGEKTVTLCDLSLDEAIDFFAHKKKKELNATIGRVGYYQDHRRNLTPLACYDLVVRVQGKPAVLVLELDEVFAALLRERVELVKTAKAEKKEGE